MSTTGTITSASADDMVMQAIAGDRDAVEAVLVSMDATIGRLVADLMPAGRYSREDREDATQDARVAVLAALADYRVSTGATLRTYAYPRMRAAVADAASRFETTGDVDPADARRVWAAIARAGGDHDAAWLALSESRGMSRQRFDAVVSALAGRPLSVDALTDACGETWEDGATPATGGDAGDGPDRAVALVDRMFNHPLVSQRHELVMRGLYGIGDVPREDPESLAARMGVSKGRFRAVKAEAFAAGRIALAHL